jgi:hypothetical protein
MTGLVRECDAVVPALRRDPEGFRAKIEVPAQGRDMVAGASGGAIRCGDVLVPASRRDLWSASPNTEAPARGRDGRDVEGMA